MAGRAGCCENQFIALLLIALMSPDVSLYSLLVWERTASFLDMNLLAVYICAWLSLSPLTASTAAQAATLTPAPAAHPGASAAPTDTQLPKGEVPAGISPGTAPALSLSLRIICLANRRKEIKEKC